jgi:DNA-binding NtrC family response regulator
MSNRDLKKGTEQAEGPEPYQMLVFLEDQARAKSVVRDLQSKGCRAQRVSKMAEAFQVLGERAFDMVLAHALMGPSERQALIEKAKEGNPDVIVVLMGTAGRKGDDHDTVSWRAKSDVFTPAGLPDVWDRVSHYLNQTRLYRRVSHAWDLIRTLQGEVSGIADGLSILLLDELSAVATEMRAILDGEYGGMDLRASDRVRRLLERVEGLTEVIQSLRKDLLSARRLPE